jgi:DNA-binding beta-propeller fold protein YncE/4-amino-4-deoxy-L-arabinose transferase-like glycosyltransferase
MGELWMNLLRRLGMQTLKARGFIASLVALFLAWRGQAAYDGRDLGGTQLYLLAFVVLIVGYLFTYKNRYFFRIGSYPPPPAADTAPATTLRVRRVTPLAATDAPTAATTLRVRRASSTHPSNPTAPTIRPSAKRGGLLAIWQVRPLPLRLGLGMAATLVSVVAVILHEQDQLNVPAILLWAVSLALLAAACAKQQTGLWPVSAANPDEMTPAEDDGAIVRRGEQPDHRLEYLLLGLILMVAIAVRAYGLSYKVIGLHTDETQIGLMAKALLHGDFAVAPPLTVANWFYFPSGTMWTMLPGLALFGDDTPAGIHFSSALFSVLDIFAVFLLVRLLWGRRTALIAAALLSCAPTILHFSLYPAGTEQLALFWTLAFYFFFKGLRSKRYLDFVWAGYSAAASLFFYPSSRSILFLFAILIGYLFVTRLRFLPNYWRQIGVFGLSLWLLAAPTLVYTFYHKEVLFERLNQVSIFSPFGASIAFNDWGLGYPVGDQPITPQTVLANWQPWLNLLGEQAKHTYLGLNFYEDRTYFYQTGRPLLPTLPAMLTTLGIAYCLWRWRDPRYFLLTIWFWVGLFLSTVLTINPPELLRMAGVVQTFYIFIAIALNKMLYEAERSGWFTVSELRRWPEQQVTALRKAATIGRLRVRAARSAFHLVAPATLAQRPDYLNITAALLVALLMTQGLQQYYDGFRDAVRQWADLTIDGYYLRNAQQDYHVYYVGAPNATISFPPIQFLAPHLEGENVARLTDVLPFSRLLNRDALFLLLPNHIPEGGAIRGIYPDALEQNIPYIDGQLFRQVYIVRANAANAKHGVRAGYFAGGNVYQLDNLVTSRQERVAGLDASNPPPAGLSYPAVGVWEGSVYADDNSTYTLKIEGGTGLLILDQQTVLRVKAGQEGVAVQVQLTRGWHPFSMRVALTSASQQVRLGMIANARDEQSVPFEHFYPISLHGFNESGQANAGGTPIGQSSAAPLPNIAKIDPLLVISNGLENGYPNAVGVDPNGNIFVGIGRSPHVYKFDKSGKLVEDWAALPDQPGQDKPILIDLTVDSKGQVYILDPLTKNLEVYDNDGKLIGHRNTNNKFAAYAPNGLAVDKAGNIYIANTGGSDILKIDPDDNLVREIGGGNDFPTLGDTRRTNQPIDVAVTDDGAVYVVDLSQRIVKYGADGKYVTEWKIPNLGGGIASMHMASYKNFVYLSDTNSNVIYLLNTDGSIISYGSTGDRPGQFDNPAGLATDAVGRLYVADRNNRRVQVFDLNGKLR